MPTLTSIIEDLASNGFTAHFGVVDNRLRAFGSKEAFEPHEVTIRGHWRLEGISDPDDMAIVYAIESGSGVRGSLVDAFGVYSDPKVGAFLQGVPIQRPEVWVARAARPVAAPLLRVNLAEQLATLAQESTWRTSGHNAITLVKQPGLRLVLLRLGPGAKLSEHRTGGPLVLHLLSGSLRFEAGSRVETIRAGELVVLEPAISHAVQALDESACVLTLVGAVG